MNRFMRTCIAMIAIAIVSIGIMGVVLAESGYMTDGAMKETVFISPDGWRAKTSTAGAYWYRIYTNLRGWGGADYNLKDEAIADCYHCTTTLGTGRNSISNFWHYGATLHISRYQITSTEYAGYTSHDGSHSSYGCWSIYCF